MSLLDDIVRDIKNWVREIVDNAISGVKTWTRNVVKAAIDAVDWVIYELTEYIDNSVHYWGDIINKTFIDARQFFDYSRTYIDQSIHYLGDMITQNITNVIGASEDWVRDQLTDERSWTRNFFKLMDPLGFLKDPIGHMKAVFNLQRQAAETAVIRSFWEGLEEGLTE